MYMYFEPQNDLKMLRAFKRENLNCIFGWGHVNGEFIRLILSRLFQLIRLAFSLKLLNY